MKTVINNSRDFIYLLSAKQCNPNGDPDNDNRPRMDDRTNIGYTTDVRLKRSIREYLFQQNTPIFYNLNSVGQKVSLQTKVSDEFSIEVDEIKKSIGKKKKKSDNTEDEDISIDLSTFNGIRDLYAKICDKFIDVRFFGGLIGMLKNVSNSVTGPIQISQGNSFNKISLIDSVSSIVSTMSDGNSTFGKDYRIHYGLYGFMGTISSYNGQKVNLTEEDIDVFRNAIWNASPSLNTRSKMGQSSAFYLEIEYNEGYSSQSFGDLRDYVRVISKTENDMDVRSINDLEIDCSELMKLINENTGVDKKIKRYYLNPDNNKNINF